MTGTHLIESVISRGPLASVAVFGGSFDPVHIGHLASALDARAALRADQMRLLPCHISPLKGASQATPVQRLAMLRLALAECPELTLDERELHRSPPSYTLDTLRELRAELGEATAIILVLGWDALQQLHLWHRWRELLSLANIAVLRRPGPEDPLDPEVQALMENVGASPVHLRHFAAGRIALLANPQLDISATDLRKRIVAGRPIRFLVPEGVRSYIEEQHLYQDSICCNRR